MKEINKVLTKAHSHNDYERTHPLLDALSYGFNSIEVDIYFKDDPLFPRDLYVGHWSPKTITFSELYLKPLRKRVLKNGGKVYCEATTSFLLLVDIKSQPYDTYYELKYQLKNYKDILTSYRNGIRTERAITIILSGNSPDISILELEEESFLFLDGRKEDLGKGHSSLLIPLISEKYSDITSWKGHTPINEIQLSKVQNFIDKASKENKMVRFWNTPDNIRVWNLLLNNGIGLIGSDRIEKLYNFFHSAPLYT